MFQAYHYLSQQRPYQLIRSRSFDYRALFRTVQLRCQAIVANEEIKVGDMVGLNANGQAVKMSGDYHPIGTALGVIAYNGTYMVRIG